MKRFAWFVAVALAFAATGWLLRAVYLYRVWQMATAWYPATPAPRFAPCFWGDVTATSAHGVFADIAFVRVRLGGDAARNEPFRQTVVASAGLGDANTVPLTAGEPGKPCLANRTRNEPFLMPVARWGECYGVADWFRVAAVTRGSAFVQHKPNGGMVLLDADRATLYIAAYRTR